MIFGSGAAMCPLMMLVLLIVRRRAMSCDVVQQIKRYSAQ